MKSLFASLIFAVLLVPGLAAAQPASTLDEIKSRGSIRLGYRPSEPPMSFRDGDGAVVGYTVDICNRIAAAATKAAGVPDAKVEYVAVNADNRFEAVQDGRIDILCGSTTKTLSRRELVDFTQLTFVTGAALLSLNSAPISQLQELAGKKVAIVEKTTTIDVMRKATERAGIKTEIVAVKDALAGAAALEAGEVDAFERRSGRARWPGALCATAGRLRCLGRALLLRAFRARRAPQRLRFPTGRGSRHLGPLSFRRNPFDLPQLVRLGIHADSERDRSDVRVGRDTGVSPRYSPVPRGPAPALVDRLLIRQWRIRTMNSTERLRC